MSQRRARAVAFLFVVMTAARTATAVADVVIRRDRVRESGTLQSCVGARCQWSGRALPRAEIAWIGFGEAGEPPAPQDPARDQVWLRDGRTMVGEVIGLSLGSVATETDSFDRPDVTWVYFGSVEGLPRLKSAPSGDVSTAPPPRAEVPTPTAPNAAQAPTPPQPEPPVPALLLNEIRFLPQENQAQFVEIANLGTSTVSLDGVSLRNDKGASLALGAGKELEAGAFFLVRFDGAKSTEKGVVHAPASALLGRASGGLWLAGREGTLDGVAWGTNQPRAVELCRGGRCSEPAPGSVIARLPDVATALRPAAWAPLDPELATPGGANPRPPVSAIAGFPGMLFFGKARFSWYSVSGAASYRLEVSRDERFADIVHRATVTGEGERLQQVAAEGPELPAGSYFWRVVATSASGAEATPSSPISFVVRPLTRRAGDGGARGAVGGAEGSTAATPPSPNVCAHIEETADPSICKELDVPVFSHAKDTEMLALEAWREKPIGSWDTPDFGPYPYCARAGVQMVHEYYRRQAGSPRKLSQDRLGHQVYEGLRTGPEYDLPVVGIIDGDTTRYSLPLALGTRGEYHSRPYETDPGSAGLLNWNGCRDYQSEQARKGCELEGWAPQSMECIQHLIAHEDDFPCPPGIKYAWGYTSLAAIRAEIDAGRPVISTTPDHLHLWVGYADVEDDTYLIFQDARGRFPVRMGEGGPDFAANAFVQNVESFWTGLAAVALGGDEAAVAANSDDDELVDFDERRFGTKADHRDSDDDGVDDKTEIRASVWDPDHGYHRMVRGLPSTASRSQVESAAQVAELSGRDFDGDGKMMELDSDSDNGGCKDGEEDLNGNGIRDPGETSNFDKSDDPKAEDGTCGLWTGTVETRYRTRQDEHSVDWQIVAQVRLREVNLVPLIDPGPDHGGRRAGARAGSQVRLECAGTTFLENYRQEIWSRVDDYRQICTASGTKTVEEGNSTEGLIFRKSADFDLTPLLGFDMPKGGGIYWFSCSPGATRELPMSCTCSGAGCQGPHSDLISWTGPAGIGGAPSAPYRGCYDPEVRFLTGGGNQMTGTYSYDREPGDCVPYHADVSWSLCRVGTPCAPLPPLPTVADAPP